MSAHGLEVFDKTLQTTHDWLNDIRPATGGDRRLAWHVLGLVLTEIRAALPRDLAAHLGAELPLLVRAAYYQSYRPSEPPRRDPDLDAFLARIAASLAGSRPVDVPAAVGAVLAAISRHVPRQMVAKAQGDLPKHLRAFWAAAARDVVPPPQKGDLGSYSAGGRRARTARAEAPEAEAAVERPAREIPPAEVGGMNARPLDETLAGSGPGIPDEAVGPGQASVPERIEISEDAAASRMARKLEDEAERRSPGAPP